jgi:hypothetical protein
VHADAFKAHRRTVCSSWEPFEDFAVHLEFILEMRAQASRYLLFPPRCGTTRQTSTAWFTSASGIRQKRLEIRRVTQ